MSDLKAVWMVRANNLLRLLPIVPLVGTMIAILFMPYVNVTGQVRSDNIDNRLYGLESNSAMQVFRTQGLEDRLKRLEDETRINQLDYVAFRSEVKQITSILYAIATGMLIQYAITAVTYIQKQKGEKPS